ncbi:flywch zinc finger domain-containing protein [Aphelenchoides avenae]|nr:flywch zinc finger domain-containing protein [Aphelenchus avenae]KAH7713590.1 flywch zinc finger domain-containing protein [Aphelenchus avenae]
MAQSVLSVRNQPKIVDNGYAYTFDKRSKDETLRLYRCDKRWDDCPARIHVSVETGEIVSRLYDHNHGSDAARIEAAKVVAGAK